jgi:hypothetical protein
MLYVVFSIDKSNDLRTKKKFYKFLDDHTVMGKFKSVPKIIIGSYKNILEESFILLKEDYDRFVSNTDFVSNQESVMIVSVDHKNRMLASLQFKDGATKKLGRLENLTKKDALQLDGWSYNPDNNNYYGVKS